jgi:hypothetical protein
MADTFARVKHIYGTEADWAANDIVLLAGEIGFADVSGVILGKIGDGTSLFSELEYTLGTAAIPLAGTTPGYNVTGPVTWENASIGREFTIEIEEGNGIDNLVISASGGINASTASIYVETNGLSWQFSPDGKLFAPDILFTETDGLALVNKDYVDNTIAGGISSTYVPLIGNLGGDPVTGRIEFYNATLDLEYNMGIIEGFGFDSFVITGAGTNVVDAEIVIQVNSYLYKFEKNGRLFIPDITYGAGDATAAATKAFVDQLRQDCIDAGLVIPAPVT